MKSKLNLFAATAVAMGLFSCNDDLSGVSSDNQGLIGNAETYTTISIAMPGGEVGSRALTSRTDAENGDGTELGTDTENAFKSVSLYFFDGNEATTSKCLGILELSGNEFNKTENAENKTVVYTAEKKKVGIEGSNMAVYAVVNGSVPAITEGTVLNTFLKKTVTSDNAIINGESSLSHLLMTSRNYGSLSLTVKDNGTADKAATLNVSVERTAAKITFKATNNNAYVVNKEDGTTKAADVTITDYKLVNLRNDAYFFRKVGSSDGTWTDLGDGVQNGNNYVIDPKFADKTLAAASAPDFTTTWFGTGKAYAENPTIYTTLPTSTEHTTLGYCMENTMAQAAQLNGYSTGVIFKALYTPVTVWTYSNENKLTEVNYEGGNFYRINNELFKTKDDAKKKYGEEVADKVEEFIATTEEGKSGAICYYQYWIRHQNNNDNDNMGIMEFAIVRNNAYKLDITGVSGLGDPDDKIDPETPDETSKTYLTVNVTILPWVVRNNSIIL